MNTYVMVVMPFGDELSLKAESEKEARLAAWASLSDERKSIVSYIETVDVLEE